MSTNEELFTIIVQIEVKPEHLEEFKVLIKHDALESRKEEGCVRFDVMQDAANEHVFHLYEVYVGQAGFAFHMASPHFAEFSKFKDSGAFANEPVVHAGLKSVDFTF